MIDASIYNSANKPTTQLNDPLETMGKVMTLKSLSSKNAADEEVLKAAEQKRVITAALPVMQQLADLTPEERAQQAPTAIAALAKKGVPLDNWPKDQMGNPLHDESVFQRSYTTLANSPVGLELRKAQGEALKLGYDNTKSQFESKQLAESIDPNSELSKRARQGTERLLAQAGIRGVITPETTAYEINNMAKEGLPGKAMSGMFSLQGRQMTADRVANSYNRNVSNREITAASRLMGSPVLNKESNKLNAARGVQALIEGIKSGEVKDSKNISKQLTNMIATIEMGSPGGVADREAMGVDTLYGRLQGALGYVESNPRGVLPEAYIAQLENEANSLGDRAAKNFKATSDSIIAGADQSQISEDGTPGNVYTLAKQRQQELLKKTGYDPETAERVKREDKKQAIPPMPAGMIAMKFPDGSVKKVPVELKGKMIAAGGSVVK